MLKIHRGEHAFLTKNPKHYNIKQRQAGEANNEIKPQSLQKRNRTYIYN